MTMPDVVEIMSQALRRSYLLGQTYWQQADSEFTSQHRKADVTQASFDDLCAKTVAEASAAMDQRRDLLEALEALLDMDISYQRGPKVQEAESAARVAVAKARGTA